MRGFAKFILCACVMFFISCANDTEREWDPDRGVDMKEQEGLEHRDSASQEGEVRPERDTILNER